IQSPLWAQLFWVSFAAMILQEWWILSRDRRSVKGQKRDAGSFLGLVVFMNAGYAGAFAIPWLTSYGHIPVRPDLMFFTAIGLLWFGVLFRLWSVLTLGRFFRTSVTVHDDHRLIT